jgi:apolipoprotein N-acyltransferase
MKKYKLLLLAVLSGVLLWLSWPARGFPLLLFIAFVPLLFIEDYITRNKLNFSKASLFLYSWLAFLIWNLLSTWWIYNSTLFGAVAAVIFNALFMAIVFHLYHMIRRNLFKGRKGYYVLIFFWITFEYLHLDWDLTWSWLNLGNGFAHYPEWVQWYEFTGTFGGTLWVLGGNILIYIALKYGFGNIRMKTRAIIYGTCAALVIGIPIGGSYIRYSSYFEKENPIDIVVVQPNIDPWNEKFSGMSQEEQLDKILRLAREKVDEKTDFLICPETALPEGINEDVLDDSESIDSLKALIHDFPNLKIVIGISSYRFFKPGEKLSETARKTGDGKDYYDSYNAAMYLDSTFKAQIYHKSKLVPGVEKMPFPKLMKPLEKFAIKLGGMSGSYGIQKERTPLGPVNSPIKIAPCICYESIYGDFMTGYVRKGANVIFIITNDGWWGDTPGYRQHFQYARLRAVETRRSIARSGNTGISGFINQRGDVFQPTKYWVEEVIRQKINANSSLTIYALFGDYIGRGLQYITYGFLIIHAVLLLLNMRYRIPFKKKKRNIS